MENDNLIELNTSFMPQNYLPETKDTQETAHLSSHSVEKYWVRLANTEERKTMASVLVTRMYSGKGYITEGITDFKDPREEKTFTLIVQDTTGRPIGTLSVGMDGEHGLYADILYPDEVAKLRAKDKVICEFKKFAIAPTVKNRRIIASIFHIALLYTRHFFGVTDCISEVTPAHSKFYVRFLEAEVIGAEKLCPRVNTTGVLMHLDMRHAEARALEVGGQMSTAVNDRTLYPFFFSKKDAEGILGRLKKIEGGE